MMITRLMDLQKKQDNLFKAFQKCESIEMGTIWAEKWRNISHVIQNISYEQAKENIQNKKDHICKAIRIKIEPTGIGFNRLQWGVYDLETGHEVSFGELIEKWGMK